jgi:hypothetical protein
MKRHVLRQVARFGLSCAMLCLCANAIAQSFSFRIYEPGILASASAQASVSQGPYSFVPCGASGISGPSLAQCTAAYRGTSLAGLVSTSGGIQTWTVPQTGTYAVVLAGAGGGTATAYSAYSAGNGAVIATALPLTQGTVLHILVGERGTTGYYDAGGGGATYIVAGTTLLAVAGGGGGVGGTGGSGINASVSTATESGHGHGTDGWGGGGSGYSQNGILDGSYDGQSYAYTNGGTGGGITNACGANYVAPGGFGGAGGGGCSGGGSGGGYSATPTQGGDGGNSYSSTTITSGTATNAGDGYATFMLN